uniref:Uncharacterized protein n=1 Tax=Arundo donax TaxID=35708 RepID=A0A0A9AKK5_ARUDO
MGQDMDGRSSSPSTAAGRGRSIHGNINGYIANNATCFSSRATASFDPCRRRRLQRR